MKFRPDVDVILKAFVPAHLRGPVGSHITNTVNKALEQHRSKLIADAVAELGDTKFPDKKEGNESPKQRQKRKIRKVKK